MSDRFSAVSRQSEGLVGFHVRLYKGGGDSITNLQAYRPTAGDQLPAMYWLAWPGKGGVALNARAWQNKHGSRVVLMNENIDDLETVMKFDHDEKMSRVLKAKDRKISLQHGSSIQLALFNLGYNRNQ